MHSERPPDPPQNQLLNQLFGQWKKITFFFVIYGVMAMLWDDIIVKSEQHYKMQIQREKIYVKKCPHLKGFILELTDYIFRANVSDHLP